MGGKKNEKKEGPSALVPGTPPAALAQSASREGSRGSSKQQLRHE
ncbi:hypothetical protein CGMCC3_g12195 [Colletotrichum fructicola]|nr:uncharacterized protein CGMCC3_g12195 [Colletotrichum fructicola]KAE9571670.1 hypothetical protein CGMCC3_g12195 [Colletotrichum fructicola]